MGFNQDRNKQKALNLKQEYTIDCKMSMKYVGTSRNCI